MDSFLLRVNSLDFRGSLSDGPGIRTVLYLQGCSRGCPGCHNPSTQPAAGGTLCSVSELEHAIRTSAPTKRLTISGGEPLEQSRGVMALASSLSDFDLALYTGAELEQVPEELLQLLDWIKVGRYDDSRRSTVLPYVGSANQRFLDAHEVFTKVTREFVDDRG